ncbi:hypothetical protein BH18ACT15_BH18ACT15_05800 [soil metagenome]
MLVLAGLVGGALLARAGVDIKLSAPPLAGHFDWHLTPWAVIPLSLAALVVLFGPRAAERLPWRSLLLSTVVTGAIWAVALATTRGWSQVTAPLTSRYDYLPAVALVDSPVRFIDHFVDEITSYPIHVQGHPPGMVLVLWALARLGLGGAGWAAVLAIGAGVSSFASVLVAMRAVAGEAAARRVAPFLALSPLALWVATSADAFYAGVTSASVALMALAAQQPRGRGDLQAAGAGLLFGSALFLSYGFVLLLPLLAAPAMLAGRWRPAVIAAAGVACVVALFAAAGFWWPEGLNATTTRYQAGVAADRPYAYFLFANLAALGLAVGPAVAGAAAYARKQAALILPAASLAGVLAADLTGLSKGEVERIWLPFAVWLMAATVLLPRPLERRWLTAQALVALLVQIGVRTQW